jgi:hypothetical protein
MYVIHAFVPGFGLRDELREDARRFAGRFAERLVERRFRRVGERRDLPSATDCAAV